MWWTSKRRHEIYVCIHYSSPSGKKNHYEFHQNRRLSTVGEAYVYFGVEVISCESIIYIIHIEQLLNIPIIQCSLISNDKSEKKHPASLKAFAAIRFRFIVKSIYVRVFDKFRYWSTCIAVKWRKTIASISPTFSIFTRLIRYLRGKPIQNLKALLVNWFCLERFESRD